MDPRLARLHERRDRALADLTELEAQVAGGEIDGPRAEVLRRRYAAEAVEALAAIDSYEATPPTRSARRIWVGSGAFVVVALVAFVALIRAVEPRPPGGFITGGVASEAVESGGVDLSTVTDEELEAVVAANPEVTAMRLALARRYVEAGEFSRALPHYMYVLERETHPEALMYLGYMTYASGEAETGVALLERSLAIQPDNPLAKWFLANALFYGLSDLQGAVPLLEEVIDSGMAPPEVVSEAMRMLETAREGGP